MLQYVLVASLLSLIYYIFFQMNSNYWKKRDVVQENSSTALGVILEFLLGDRSLAEICREIYIRHSKEPYVGVLWGTKPALILRDPTLIQHVFINDFQSFHARGFVANTEDKLADNVLFIDELPRWKLIRQKVSPIFTSSKLKNMFYILEHCGRDFTSLVEKNMNTHPFNLIYTYTTASIGSAVFGINTSSQNTMKSPFLEMSMKSINPTFMNNLRFFISNTWKGLFKLLKMKLLGDNEEFFIGVVKKVLQERQLETEKRHDFIDMCIELQKNGPMHSDSTGYVIQPSDEVLAAQAYFFFLAGADTSANTMNFTLLELSHNPEILNRLQIEIDETHERCKETPTYEDVDKMQYLDMVINEAMRKYPPIGLLQRKCTRNTILPVGNLKVEKGVMMIIPVYALHRDETLFKNPNVYDPERFRNVHNTSSMNFTYLPFGEGNRICLGARFARLQVKVGLASLLRHFTVQPKASLPKSFERSFFALKATDKLYYSFEPRYCVN